MVHANWKTKLQEWLKRYGPAEIAGTICTLIAGTIAGYYTDNLVIIAYVGSSAENIGFYIFIIAQEIRSTRRYYQQNNQRYGLRAFIIDMRNVILEFGTGELFDWFLIRPASIYFALSSFGNVQLGLLVGKILGNISFYIPTIISYELRKRFFGDTSSPKN